MTGMHRHANLLEVVQALRSSGTLSGRLYRRQQQSNQDANNGNDNQELDKRKSAIGWKVAGTRGSLPVRYIAWATMVSVVNSPSPS